MGYKKDGFHKNLEDKKSVAEAYKEYAAYYQANGADVDFKVTKAWKDIEAEEIARNERNKKNHENYLKRTGKKPKPDEIETKEQENKKIEKETWKKFLANLVAANQKSAQPRTQNMTFPEDVKTGQDRAKYLKDNMILEIAGVYGNVYYKDMVNHMDNKELQKACEEPGKFAQKLARTHEHYRSVFNNNKTANYAGELAENLSETKKSSKNSKRYEKALQAMTDFSKGGAPLPAVNAVKNYLSDKAKPRWTKTGRKRFQECMNFLHDTMPPDEFKQYCDGINRDRGASTRHHKDYISPEMFGRPRTPKELVQDLRTKVKNGYEITERDCAAIEAGFQIGNENGALDRAIDPAKLADRVERIEIHAKDFMNNIKGDPQEVLKAMLNDPEIENSGFIGMQKRKENMAKEKERQEKQAAHDKQAREEKERKLAENRKKIEERMEKLKEVNPEAHKQLVEMRAAAEKETNTAHREEMMDAFRKERHKMFKEFVPEPKVENNAPKAEVKAPKAEHKAPVQADGPVLVM